MADEPRLEWAGLGQQVFKVDDGDDGNGLKQRKLAMLDPTEQWAPGVTLPPLKDGRSAITIEGPHVFHGRSSPTINSARPAEAFTSFFGAFAPIVPTGPRPVTLKINFRVAALELSPGGFIEVGFSLYKQPARSAADLVTSWSGRYTFSGIAASGLSLASPPDATASPAPSTADGEVNRIPMTSDTIEWKNIQPGDYAFLARLLVQQPRTEREDPLEDMIGFDILLSSKATEAILAYELGVE